MNYLCTKLRKNVENNAPLCVNNCNSYVFAGYPHYSD